MPFRQFCVTKTKNMKNSVTQLCLWFLAVLVAGPLLAQQQPNFDFAKPFTVKAKDKSIYSGKTLCQDDSGYVYMAFTVMDTADLDPNAGTFTCIPQTGNYATASLAKYTPEGNLVWAKNLTVDVFMSAVKLVIHEGALYLFGQYRNSADFDPSAATAYLTGNPGGNTPYVAKYTLNGDYVFARNMAATTGDVLIADVATTTYHTFVVVGAFSRATDFDPSASTYTINPVQDGYYDGYVASYDSNFTSVSAYRLSGGAGSTQWDYVENVEIDNNNNIYLAGYTGSSTFYSDLFSTSSGQLNPNAAGNAFIIKYNYLLQRQWGYLYASNAFTDVYDLLVDYTSLYALVRCDGDIVDFDFGANTANTGFYNNPGFALVKLDENGAYGFHKAWQAPNANSFIEFNKVQISSNGILVSGNYRGSIDVDPDVMTVNTPPTDAMGTNSIFALLNFSGNLLRHKEFTGSANRTENSAFQKSNSQYIYVAGTYSDTINFGTDTKPEILFADKTDQFSYNAYLAKYDFFDEAPDTASKAMTFTNVTDTTMTVSFTKGNGNKRIVIAREATAVTAEPTDGIYHYSDTVFGMGNNFGSQFAVYNDTGSSFTITGLSPNTVYHYAVFEYNGSSSQINYLTSSVLTGSKKTTLNGISPTAVNNPAAENAWHVYPNPANNFLTVESAAVPGSNAMVLITDISGKLILQQDMGAAQRSIIDVSSLSAGIYIVAVQSNDGIYKTRLMKCN